MGVRISAVDWVEGGTTIEDTIVYTTALKELGCDFVDITTAGLDSRQRIRLGKGYQVPCASAVKKAVDLPVMTVGMIIEPPQADVIEAILTHCGLWQSRSARTPPEVDELVLQLDAAYSGSRSLCLIQPTSARS